MGFASKSMALQFAHSVSSIKHKPIVQRGRAWENCRFTYYSLHNEVCIDYNHFWHQGECGTSCD